MSDPVQPKPLPTRRRPQALDGTFNKCPNGHSLPHGECSSAKCEETFIPKDATSENPRSEEAQLNYEVKRLKAHELLRNKLIPVPEGLEGATAEAFVEQRLTNLSVDAVIELEYALKYGTASERERARDRILDATGHGKREGTRGGTQLIIVNGVGTLPWKGNVVEGSVVTAALPDA